MKDPYALNSAVLANLSFSEIERLDRVGQDIANKEGTTTQSEVIIRMLLKGLEQYEAEIDRGEGMTASEPCPFCGGTVMVRGWGRMYCLDCGWKVKE